MRFPITNFLAVEQKEGLTKKEELVNSFSGSVNNDSLHTKSALLSNTGIPIVQRQKIAAQIGRVGGNHYLQGVMAQKREDVESAKLQQLQMESTVAGNVNKVLQKQDTGAAENEQSEAEATETRLNQNGITIQSSGGCRDRSSANCTSVEGIRTETIDGLIAFRNNAGMDLIMTGGTEVGHAAGTHSHTNGYKVDLALNNNLNSYIETNFTPIGQRSDGAELYEDDQGNQFARKGNHWDITFY